MEKIVVYVDDAQYAQQQLEPMKSGAGQSGTHWVLVACAPRMTQRVSKWLSHGARENWRNKWADKLFGQLVQPLQHRGDQVTTVLAKGPLPELTRALCRQHAASRVLDARRPKFGEELQPVTADQTCRKDGWATPGAVMGLGAVLVLAAE